MVNRGTIKHTQAFDNKQLFKGDDDCDMPSFDEEQLSSEDQPKELHLTNKIDAPQQEKKIAEPMSKGKPPVTNRP